MEGDGVNIVAIDKTLDTVTFLKGDWPDHEKEGGVRLILRDQPKLVLFIPLEKNERDHSHIRYHISGNRLKKRLCRITDVPQRVRTAFLLT